MAPRLAVSQLDLIRDALISSPPLTTSQIARIADCSPRSVRTIRLNLHCFGNVRAPPNGVGCCQSITPSMLNVLCDHLLKKPNLYQDEMVLFLWDGFRVLVTVHIGRALQLIGWSKKTSRQIAKQRNADLRDFYLHNLSEFHSYHLVYVDESGCDKQMRFQQTSWSPLGITPVQVSHFQQDQRYQILPAYAQDGIVLSRVF